jgi:hypothetical protein
MSEMGPVVINPEGTPRRVSIMEAILHKSYASGGVLDRRLIMSIESDMNVPSEKRRSRIERHKIDMLRRSNKTTQRVKVRLMKEIGPGVRFTTFHPVFAAICEEYGYSPYSLIGSLVKYKFVSKVGLVAHPKPTRSGARKLCLYEIIPPTP